MNGADTLKLNKDFKRLYYKGSCAVSRSVVVYVQKNRFNRNRLGLTCGKSIGKAVKRNRAKRLMRESYRILSDRLIKGFDIVIIARTAILEKNCGDVLKDLHYALSKLNLL